MYKLSPIQFDQTTSLNVIRTIDGACIPLNPDNTDYAQFKKDLSEGAFLKDAEGNDLTAEQITTFLGTLT